jgi:phosphate transport system permease protein
MREDRALLGTSVEKWVLAEAEVDQYLKGKPNRLKKGEKKLIDTMRAEGRARLAFNSGFFENGDSKLPEMAGIWSAAVGSMYVLFITFIFSFPIGVMSAIYLEEFAPNNRLMEIVEVNINNLAAIPSILFGLLGLAIFINFFGVPRSSALAGGLTLSLMTLPIIIISTRAAIRAVPDSIREGSLALGATRWQMVLTNVLPLSLPGILTGTIIGLAQAIGETAPLLIVGMMAYIPEAPTGFTSAATVLPAQIYTWSSDSLRAFTERTSAGIIVLLAVMLTMNAVAIYLRNKYETKW